MLLSTLVSTRNETWKFPDNGCTGESGIKNDLNHAQEPQGPALTQDNVVKTSTLLRSLGSLWQFEATGGNLAF